MAKHLRIIAAACVGVLLVAGTVWYSFYSTHQKGTEEAVGKQLAFGMIDAAHLGGPKAGLAQYDLIVNSATTTPLSSAPAIIAGTGLRYRSTASTADAIKSVRDLQVVAADAALRPFIRASAIVQLALWYRRSGYDQEVYDAIFGVQPYGQLKKTSTSDANSASIRALLSYADNVSPTFDGAIAIANSYVSDLYFFETSHPDAEQTKNAIDGAEQYLAKAEDLASASVPEQSSNPVVYRNYLSDRAFVIGALAHFKGAPYDGEYKTAYQTLIPSLEKAHNEALLVSSLVRYARFLIEIDNDSATAKLEADKAVGVMQQYPPAADNTVMTSLRASLDGKGQFDASGSLGKLLTVSPELKAIVESSR